MDDVNIFECINIMNETNIDYKIKNKKDYNINIEIRNILKDEAIFFKITQQRAYQLLEKLEIKKEKINIIYEKLISKKNFYNLLYNKKIDIDDKTLLIKYPTYDVLKSNSIITD